MMAVFVTPLMIWVGWAPVVALLLGYASHLLGDSATKSGIRLRYPKTDRFYLLPKKLRFTTGSLAEEVLMAPLGVLAIFLLLFHLIG